MNQFRAWYTALPRAIRALLAINVAIFMIWAILLVHIAPIRDFVFAFLALRPELPGLLFRPWQLITYNFLHLGVTLGGVIHILFNMLLLYWIGRDHEEMHGSPQMLAIYLIAGVVGGLLVVLFSNLFPNSVFAASAVYGASASVFGVMTMVATFYPDKRLGLLLLGPVKIVHIIIALLLLDLITLGGSRTAVAAHWGGVLAGFMFARAEQRGIDLSSWASIFFPGGRQRGTAPPPRRTKDGFLSRAASWIQIGDPSEEESEAPRSSRSSHSERSSSSTRFTEDEIDRILDKISEQGMEALSERERKILEEASKR